MEIYLVGGAVRDELLRLPVQERDWVVVGSTPEQMTAQGYRQVGRDFPVYLHPQTNDEYALARTERKTAPGHTGFVVHAGAEVTLDQDLIRRDLTINAMARDSNGVLVDLFNGREDLSRRCLRHVSPAFSEDPLRVFRVARFTAQLEGFVVAPETSAAMREMSAGGALDELSAERVWRELHKALSSADPNRFLETLRDTGSLTPWFAEFTGLLPIIPTELKEPLARYSAMAGVLAAADCERLSARLKTPVAYRRLAILLARWGTVFANWPAQPAQTVQAALNAASAFKADSLLDPVLRIVEALGHVDLADLRQMVQAVSRSVQPAELLAQGLEGAALGKALEAARLQKIVESQS